MISKKNIAFAFYLAISGQIVAQNLNTASGYIPGRPYGNLGVDTINYANGGVSFNIPIRSFKQQDPVSIDYSITYSSKHLTAGWTEAHTTAPPIWIWTDEHTFANGFDLDLPDQPMFSGARLSLNQDYRASWWGVARTAGPNVVVTPDGGHHIAGLNTAGLNLLATSLPTDSSNPTWLTQTIDRGGVLHTTFAENNVVNPVGAQAGSVPLLSYRGFSPAMLYFDAAGKPNHIVDAQGRNLPWADPNTGTVGVEVSPANCPATVPADKAFRIDFPSPPGQSSTYYLCYTDIHVQTNFCLGPAHVCRNSGLEANSHIEMLTSVKLPNSQFWGFVYDDRDVGDGPSVNYGTLTKLLLPTGGSIKYQYATVQPCPASESEGTQVSRFLQTRQEFDNSSASPRSWTYSFVPGTVTATPYGNGDDFQYSYTNAAMTVTQPNGVQEVHSLRNDDSGCAGYEDSVKVYDPAGTLIQKVENSYRLVNWGSIWPPLGGQRGLNLDGNSTWIPDPEYLKAATWTTIPGPSSQFYSLQLYEYDVLHVNGSDHSYGNITRSCTVDPPSAIAFDPSTGSSCTLAPAKKRAETIYEYQVNPAVAQANLYDLPHQKTSYNDDGTVAAQTKFEYGGDAVNYPVGTMLSQSSWLNAGAGIWLTTTLAHDSHGTITSSTDPLLNTASYGYDSSSVYLQTTTLPATNGQQHYSVTQFDPNTDLPVRAYDENGSSVDSQSTTYTYDALLRPLTVRAPTIAAGVPGASLTYDDPTRIVTATMPITASQSVTASASFDQWGRTVSSSVTDQTGTTIIDTNYDIMGRVVSITNPYRTAADVTFGQACTTYDFLGRPLQKRQVAGNSCASSVPSITSQHWAYNGPITDVYDGVGHHSQQVVDGLGQLRNVKEPDDSNTPAITTQYTYDALGNLKTVAQLGAPGSTDSRLRFFNYDSLSHLTASYNPETGVRTCPGMTGQWSVCYGYDANGNVTSKTDARDIVVSMQYDALGRLTSKTYSTTSGLPDPANTPANCYKYDEYPTTSLSSGKLTSEWTQLGSCSSSLPTSALTSRQIFQYDRAGNVLSEKRTIGGGYHGYNNQYDLAGNRQGYSFKGTQATQVFDGMHRLLQLTYGTTPIYKVQTMGPLGPLSVDIGTAMKKVTTYDPAGRVSGEITLRK